METENAPDTPQGLWSSGTAYEAYVGRWSRLVAQEFIEWLRVAPEATWLDAGCGTGSLSESILNQAAPKAVTGIDPSAAFIAHARNRIDSPRIHFTEGDAQDLPYDNETFDAVISGLVLNFIPDPSRAVAEMSRVVRTAGTVAAYVWDYAGRMDMMRHFWGAASELDPAARELDEGQRCQICHAEPLAELFQATGLTNIEVRAFDVQTVFQDFDDYWVPLLGGRAPAPSYAVSLDEHRQATLRERIRSNLPIRPDGTISLIARAWAVRGTH